MITTSDLRFADRLRRLREHGMNVDAFARHSTENVLVEEYLELGFNFRMTDIQAAVGLVQLGKLDEMISRRRALAGEYTKALSGIPGLILPSDPPHGTTNFQSFSVILTEEFPVERNDLMAVLRTDGISSRRGVMAAHREPAYANYPNRSLPNTEYLADRSIILPMYHEMTSGDIDRVAAVVRTAAH
jgi:dTDP-4-amino-4,6-dideoxygalactose transaminase